MDRSVTLNDLVAVLGKSEERTWRKGAIVAFGSVARERRWGDKAYAIFSSIYTFTQSGRKMREAGATAFAPVKQAPGWNVRVWH